MKSVFLLAAFSVLITANSSFASGWRCSEEEHGFTVALYNHVDPFLGTTNPSQFIVKQNGETIVHRFSPEIDFMSTQKGTTYKTTDSENSYSCVINFHIAFREGVDSIANGAKRVGKLFFTKCSDKAEETEHRIECKRYLKNP